MIPKPTAGLAVEAGARATGAVRAAGRYASRGARAAKGVVTRLRGAAGWALADQCIVSASNFFTIFLFARGLDSSTFGAFMLAYTGLLLLTNVQGALVVQPHNVLAAGLPQPQYAKFTGALASVQAIYCVGVMIVLSSIGWLIAEWFSPAVGHTLIALGVAAVPWMAQEFVRRVLYTRGRSRAAALNDGITYGLQLFGAIVLVMAAAPWATAVSMLLVLGLSSLVGVVVGIWQLHEDVGRFEGAEWEERKRVWRDAWSFGRWLTAQSGMIWFGAQGHAWVVGLMLGVEQVGIYRAATHLVNVMNPLMQACFSYLPSRGSLARKAGGAEGLARWVDRSFWILLAALAPFLIVLAGFSGPILELAYGERFSDTHLPLILSLTALGACIGYAKYPFDVGLLALHSTRSIFYVYLIPIGLLLTAGVTLIYFLGILGVPLSGLLINVSLLIATWIAYRKRMKIEASGSGTQETPR